MVELNEGCQDLCSQGQHAQYSSLFRFISHALEIILLDYNTSLFLFVTKKAGPTYKKMIGFSLSVLPSCLRFHRPNSFSLEKIQNLCSIRLDQIESLKRSYPSFHIAPDNSQFSNDPVLSTEEAKTKYLYKSSTDSREQENDRDTRPQAAPTEPGRVA
jgi:hypothetical protein